MRGQRKPTALKLLHGEKNKDRINPNEPKPVAISPAMPAHLDAIDRKVWRAYAPALERNGLLTEVDGPAFSTFCILEALLVRLKKELRSCKNKMLVEKTSFSEQETTEGRTNELMTVEAKINPLVKEIRMMAAAKRPYLSAFGMDPASRSKITVPGGGDEDEFFG